MLQPDTDTSFDSGPTVASRSTVMGGNGTRVAAMRLDSLLTQAAAELFGCQVVEVARHGENYISPNEESASFEQVAEHARQIGMTLSAKGRWDAPEYNWSFEQGQGKPYFAYHYGAQVAEVLVNTGTGKVEVSGFWAAHNAGTIIFPQGALGQLYGGITQGIGYALMERVDYDQGYIQATNFDEYLIPTALDVPDSWAISWISPLPQVLSAPKTLESPVWCLLPRQSSTPSFTLPADAFATCLPTWSGCYWAMAQGTNMACKLGLHSAL